MRCIWVLVAVAACSKSKPKEEPVAPPPAPVVAAPADAQQADAVAVAVAADGGVPCTAAAIKEARKAADAHVKAGAADKAIAILEPLCVAVNDEPADLKEQSAWVKSDLTFAYYKAGKIDDCYSLALTQASVLPDVVGEEHRVVKALEYNAELCHKAIIKKRGAFAEGLKCDSGEGYEIPDDSGRCLVIEEREADDSGEAKCGAVTLVANGKSTPLAVEEDSVFSDEDECCNISEVSFQKRKTGWALLVVATGRPCTGGKANLLTEEVLALQGNKLVKEHAVGALMYEPEVRPSDD